MSKAHVARMLEIRDEGHLRFVRSSGELIIDEGRVSGSFPGRVEVRFLYDGAPVVTAHFTIYGSGGSVSAYGTARLNNPASLSPSFKGKMAITGGSGRYAHASGRGEFYGVYYRRSYALAVQSVAAVRY